MTLSVHITSIYLNRMTIRLEGNIQYVSTLERERNNCGGSRGGAWSMRLIPRVPVDPVVWMYLVSLHR
jgi:hypothetical protein